MRAAPLRRLSTLLLPALALLALAAIAGLLWLPSADRAQAQAGQTVASDWPLIPDGIQPGDSFRLLFVTSTTRDASSSNIADYNAHVQAAANGNASVQAFKGEFRALISTSAVDARDNTATTGTGVPIHWLGGEQVADDYTDLYDKTWASVSGKTEAGSSYTGLVWTGGNKAGQKSGQRYAGADEVRLGDLSDTTLPLSSPNAAAATETYPLYALSPVITMAQPEPEPTPTPTPTPQPANSEPQFASDTAQRTANEDADVGASVGAAITATDADADTLTYSLTGSDAFAIGENTGQITVAGALDYETQQSYTLTVSVSDGKSADGSADASIDDSITVTVSIGNVDEAGVVSLSSDTPQAGDQLSATLLDPDAGVSGETWTWERSADQSAWETISGATGSAYTPSDTDVGSYLRATVAYSDGHGSGKTAQGATANAVTAAPTQGTEPASTEPAITAGPSIDSSPLQGDAYGVDELILVSYSFSEAVSVTGAPKARLLVGERKRWAHYIYPANDGATLVFVYLVKAEDRDANGVSAPRNALRLSGGTIEDGDGNAASLKHSALPDQSGHKVDGSRTAPANSPPAFAASSITRSVAEDAAVGASVGAAVTATDPDGDTLTYALTGTGLDAFTINESTGQITVQGALDYESANAYQGTVSADDGHHDAVSVSITINVVNVDEPGAVTLTAEGGLPRVDSPVSATISDPDGDASGVSWSWARSADRTAWQTITGATGASYTPSADDEGYYLQATAGYTDPHGPGKTASGTHQDPVAGPPQQQAVSLTGTITSRTAKIDVADLSNTSFSATNSFTACVGETDCTLTSTGGVGTGTKITSVGITVHSNGQVDYDGTPINGKVLKVGAWFGTTLLRSATITVSPPTTTIWTATLTVDAIPGYLGCDNTDANQDNCSTALTDDTITFQGNVYTVRTFYVDSSANTLVVDFSKDLPAGLSSVATLHVGSNSYALAEDTNVSANVLEWSNPGLSWSDRDTVSLSLTIPTPPAPQTVAPDWSLIPSGVSAGESFRLLFVTSTKRNAASTDIFDYNNFVQTRANANTTLRPFKDEFRALISTQSVNARDNTDTAPAGSSTYTTGEGVPIYWVSGVRVANDYADLYDGTWDSFARKDESGATTANNTTWTGSNNNGTAHGTNYAGANMVQLGVLNDAARVMSYGSEVKTGTNALYGLSPVITVQDNTPPTYSITSFDRHDPVDGSGEAVLPPFSSKRVKAGVTDIGVTLNFSEAIDELETTIKYQVGSGAEGTFNFTTSAPGSGDCIKNPPTGYVCTYTPTAGENGLFKVKVSAYKDLSGNAGAPGSYNTGGIVVDTTPLAAPTIALKTPSSSPGNLNMPVFTVTVPEDGLRVALFEGGCDDNWGSTSNVSDNSPPLTIDLSPVALSEGTYTYQARYTKDKYFVSPCSAAITYVYDGTPPAAPANLAVTRSAGQVTLTWDDPKDRSIVKYQIKQRTAFGAFPAAWTDIPRSDATTTSYTVTGLDDNEEYIFKLVASDAANGQGAEALTGTSLPKVVSMRLDSLPHYPNHYYGRDESIVVAVRFDLPVAVSGSSDATPTFPQLKLGGITVKPSGAADPVADYYWQEGNTVYFRWKVLAGYATPGAERFPPGGAVSIPANPIVLNGGTIQHAETGVDADLSFGGWSESDRFSHNYQAVDGSQTNVVATVNSVAMGTTGPYYYFDPIRIDVTFDVPTSGDVLKVRGLPYINVRVGANIHKFAFWGINGNVVSFGHEVEDWHSEYDPDGPSMNTGEIVMFHSGQNDEIYVERSVSITGLDVRDPQRKKKVTVTRTLRLAVDPRHPGMADQGVRHPVDGLHGGLRDGKKFKPSSAVPAPRNLTATAGDGLVRLSWDPYDGKHVEGWFVWWEGAPKWKWFDHDRTSVVVKGLTNGQEYKFRVRAEYYGSGGVVSKEVTATPQAGLSFPNRAPVWAEGRPTEGDVSIAEFLAGSDKIVLARLAFVDPEGEPLTYEIIEPPPGNAFAGIRSAFSVRIEDKGAVKPSVLDQTHQRTHEFLNRVMGLGGFQLCVKATDPHGLSASHCLFMPPAAVTTPSIFVGQAKGHVTRVARPQAATGDVTFAIQRNMTYHLPGASSSPVTHNRDPFTLGLSINPSTGLLSYDGKLVVTRPTWVEYGLYHQFRSGLHLPNEVELQVKITGNGLPAAGVIEKVRIKIWAWLE